MEKSCGAVVVTRTQNGIRYVLVQSLEGRYGFPKGHMEPGETERETALREIREEVSLMPELLPGFRETTEYAIPGTNRRKQVVFFLGVCEHQTPVYQKEELLGCKLVSYEEAWKLLPHEALKQVLRQTAAYLEA